MEQSSRVIVHSDERAAEGCARSKGEGETAAAREGAPLSGWSLGHSIDQACMQAPVGGRLGDHRAQTRVVGAHRGQAPSSVRKAAARSSTSPSSR